MASNLLKFHIHRIRNPYSESLCLQHDRSQFQTISCRPPGRQTIYASLSSSAPPASRDEAILQAKTCIFTTLERPINNNPKLTGKLKKLKQPRFRVEIPVVDDSPTSLIQLAEEVFGDVPIKRKGSKVKIAIIWPEAALAEAASQSFKSNSSNQAEHTDMSEIAENRILNAADVAVVFAPEQKHLAAIKSVADAVSPKPVLVFNPKWAFEDEGSFGEMSSFVASFDVIYAFMGLEVKGILSKKRGMVFKYTRDGVVSGEKWSVLVEEDGEMKVVSKFTARPSIGEVENVLYNLMAINSPVTKSAKFLKDLVSNVTGKK
uniref:DUF1995 domain-containing protein n=1 Tax=Kalanchoe fedtschenkoi TaxID=63787 RepID=A0A7N0V0U3_KALFE